jgi:hypothetical protein
MPGGLVRHSSRSCLPRRSRSLLEACHDHNRVRAKNIRERRLLSCASATRYLVCLEDSIGGVETGNPAYGELT